MNGPTRFLIFIIGLLIPTSKPCLPLEASAKWGLPQDTAACVKTLPQLEPKLKLANKFIKSPLISDLLSLIPEIKPFTPHLNYLLGQKKPITYLVLLQNNYEMRANGGFFGSYAVITLSPKCQMSNVKCEIYPEISFQDIYVPDGQLVGHVDPPSPIKIAFKQGWFKLRDSDWEPDFPTSAKTIRWFFEKGGEVNPDFLITLNLSTIKKILAVVGDINVPDYNLIIHQDNVYSLLQNQSEINFFPGSTQKKDVLTATGRALIKKISSLKFDQLVQLAQILNGQLNKQNILANSLNPQIQKILEEKNWAGKLSAVSCQLDNCLNDTYLLVEANLGANKANCCVERVTNHIVTLSKSSEASGEGGSIVHQIKVTFTNSSPLENPSPPRFFGGNYISYLRFYIPENATNIKVSASPTLPKTLIDYPKPFTRGEVQISILKSEISNLKEIGFFHLTAAGTSSTVSLSYDLPIQSKKSYQLNIFKQHGMETSPQEITLFNQSYSTNLETDYTVTATP